ncbi:MAG: UDP-N-acetylmuramate--L-alanine ligase [Phycisphaerales bacterium]|nr:UDP-N-acetylmuramate--L-alanine ligase [Phycisphaerales bacterium]
MPSPRSALPFTLDHLEERHFHLTGIGGCGMSGLARLLHRMGAGVAGSDCTSSPITDSLLEDGIPVDNTQDGLEIPNDCDAVICSAAIAADHPEVLHAEECGIPVLSYARMLGLVQQHRTAVCIAGTHGKSTTASMLSNILIATGLDPGFIVGANCPQIGGSCRVGGATIPQGPMADRKGILISEACEFNRSFHDHNPAMAIINNIEEDHLDIYDSIDAIIDAFRGFARRIPHAQDDGYLLIAHDGAHRQLVTPGLDCRVETFGFHPEADYQVIFDPTIRRVGILRDGMWTIQWTNSMPGAHNAMNAAAAAIMAARLGVDWEDIVPPLESFEGLDRRLQRLGEIRTSDGGSAVIYDDYGHHPTEVEMTLKALRAAELPKRLVCVFQPHQHSRTRFLLDQFAQSFSCADEVIVPHIYFVRDSITEKQRVSAQDLVDRLIDKGTAARHINDFDSIATHLRHSIRDGDLVVIMGAGPVWTIAHELLASERTVS